MSGLPTGAVTFLFTDIEGSTPLLQALGPEAYEEALAAHFRTLREACARHSGVEVKTLGDGMFAAFADAGQAVAAAAEAQTRLSDGPVRVRMGLHTGEGRVRDTDYVGLDVHRAARIADAAHGGQVLLSAATRPHVAAPVRELGSHRLKGLPSPEQLYQLGSDEFPPVRSLDRTNLPSPPTPFVGRGRELAEVLELLQRDDVRVLTLTGPGGTGKTRLAIEAAAERVGDYDGGVFFVALASLRDPRLVLATIGSAVGANEELADALGGAPVLLVLDNFEQVAAAASDVAGLLAACPRLELLVTSRRPLRIAGEHEYAVPPLTVDEAVSLFVERAEAVRPDFSGGIEVEQICRQLDGLPLALELAAARTRVLAPTQILERLGHSLSLLTGGARDVPERQRTLRGAIDWSYEALEPDEATLFAQLAVFVGGWRLEAAEAVCSGDVLDGLESLVEMSLVHRVGEDRFAMLETIREYACERLEAGPDPDRLRARHAHYFLELGTRAEEALRGADQLVWLRLLEEEQDNFRAALGWALTLDAPADRRVTGLALAAALGRFWYLHAHAVEGGDWLGRALAANADGPDDIRAKALHHFGVLHDELGNLAGAAASFEEAVALRRRSVDRVGLASSLNSLGVVARNRGDLADARAFFTEALELKRELGDRAAVSITTSGLGLLAIDEGRLADARALLEEALAIDRELGDVVGAAANLSNLAAVAADEGDASRARTLLVDALAAFREIGDGDGIAECLEQIAGLCVTLGRHEAAARLAGAAAALRAELGMPVASAADRARLDTTLARARSALGDEAFDAAYAAGQAVSETERADAGLAELVACEAAVGAKQAPEADAARSELPGLDSNQQPSG